MKHITVYTQPGCNFSRAMMHVLDLKGWEYQVVDVGSDEALRADVAERSGQTTIPQLFVEDQAIGGYSDFEKLVLSGEFVELIEAG